MKSPRTFSHHVLLITLTTWLCGGGIVRLAWAANNFWTGAADDSWHNVANWTFVGTITPLPRVPSDIDTAILSSPANDTVRLSSNTADLNGLIVGNGISLLNRTVGSTEGHLITVTNNGTGGTAITGGATMELWPDTGTFSFFTRELRTETLLMTTGGELLLRNNSTALVSGNTTLASGSRIDNFFPGGGGKIFFAGDILLDDAELVAKGSDAISFGANDTITARNSSLIELSKIDPAFGLTFNIESDSTLDVTGTTTIGLNSTLEINDSRFDTGLNVEIDGGTFRLIQDQGFASMNMPAGADFTAENDAQVTFEDTLFITDDQTYTMLSGADWMSPANAVFVGSTNSVGSMVFDGVGTTFDVNQLSIGAHSNDTSTVTMRNGAEATLNILQLNSAFNPDSTDSIRARMTIESDASVQVDSTFFGMGIGNSGAPAGSFGNLVLRSGGTLTQLGSGGTSVGSQFSTSGFLSVSDGASYTANTGNFDIAARGTLSIFGGSAAGEVEINGPLNVEGNVLVQTAGGTPVVPGGVLQVNAPVTIDGGSVSLSAGELSADSIALTNGGSFSFTGGTLRVGIFNSSLTNGGGTLAPGDSAGSTTIVGDYLQQSGGALELEIGGTSMGTTYDFVQISGNAILNGDLLLGVIDGFIPDAADTFLVLSAGDLLGVFDNVADGQRLDTFDGFGSFQVNYGISSAFDPDQIVLSDFQITADADLDNDGDIDGFDFLLIQRDFPSLIPLWQSAYGSSGLATSNAAPEPTTFGLAMLSLLGLSLARSQCSFRCC